MKCAITLSQPVDLPHLIKCLAKINILPLSAPVVNNFGVPDMYDSPTIADKVFNVIGLACLAAFGIGLLAMMAILGATYISMFVL